MSGPGGLLMMQRTWLAPWVLTFASCGGLIDEREATPDAPGTGKPGPGLATNPGAPAGAPGASGAPGVGAAGACKEAPPDAPLRRLTAAQYRNTVRDLVVFALKDDKLAATALAALKPALESVTTE